VKFQFGKPVTAQREANLDHRTYWSPVAKR